MVDQSDLTLLPKETDQLEDSVEIKVDSEEIEVDLEEEAEEVSEEVLEEIITETQETQLSFSVKMTRMPKKVLLVLSKVKKSLSELVQIDLNIMFIYLFYISFLIIVKSL
jgi:hypothetical protein